MEKPVDTPAARQDEGLQRRQIFLAPVHELLELLHLALSDAKHPFVGGVGWRGQLAAACSIHFVHDGFSDILYVLLPIWANEFRLTFAQVGLIRTAYSGGMAAFQIPAGFLAERWGERRLLAAGTAITACGFIAAGAVGGFMSLRLVLLTAGLGSGVQHPLSSLLVSKGYETGPRRAALGTYNFSGDLCKVAVPAAVALAGVAVGWRNASAE